MPNIVVVERDGNLKNMNIKAFVEGDLFKKAGFKTPTHFDCHTIWNVEMNEKKYSIELHAKTSGRANQENKYEFPPPVDKLLFFGNCILINRNLEEPLKIHDINIEEWKVIYEKLYGGFEDLIDTEENEEEEIDEIEEELEAANNNMLTKSGYLNDGFVVEDDDEDMTEDEYEEKPKKPTKKSSSSLRSGENSNKVSLKRSGGKSKKSLSSVTFEVPSHVLENVASLTVRYGEETDDIISTRVISGDEETQGEVSSEKSKNIILPRYTQENFQSTTVGRTPADLPTRSKKSRQRIASSKQSSVENEENEQNVDKLSILASENHTDSSSTQTPSVSETEPRKNKNTTKSKNTKRLKKNEKTTEEKIEMDKDFYLNCENELTEEEYL
jgi:hypothetical protein